MSVTKAMTLRLAADQALQLEAVARVDSMPVAEAVRAAIAAHIEARRADPEFRERLARILEEDRHILAQLAEGPDAGAETAQRAVQRAKASARAYA
jgi:hypothetical protein